MQDYMSSGFAPALSDKFALSSSTKFASKSYDPSIRILAHQPVQPKPASRGEFIFQQERKIRNEFLRKTSPKSMPSLSSKSSGGTDLQREKVNAQGKNSALRSKLVATAVAFSLMLFAGQLGCSLLSQQLSADEQHQTSAVHPQASINFNNTVASVRNSATTSDGAKLSAMSLERFDPAHKTEDLLAVAQVSTLRAANAEPSRSIQNVSIPTSGVNDLILSNISTVDLVKIGYERLRTGSAQESISILSEAVKRDRNDPTSRRYLGYALLQTGRTSEALEQYDALRKLSGLLPSDRLAVQHAMRIAQG